MCRHARVSCTTHVARQHAGVHGALVAHGALVLAHACARSCARCHASVHTRVCSHTHTAAATRLPAHCPCTHPCSRVAHSPCTPPKCSLPLARAPRCAHTRAHTHAHTPCAHSRAHACPHPALPPDRSVGLRAHAFPLLFLHTCTRTDLPNTLAHMPTAISVHITSPPSCTHPTKPLHALCSSSLHTHPLHGPPQPHTRTHSPCIAHSHSLVQALPACTHTPPLPKHPPLAHACTPPPSLHTTAPTPPLPPARTALCTHTRVLTPPCFPRVCTPAPTPLHARSPRPARAPRPQPPARALPRMAAAAARAARCRAL